MSLVLEKALPFYFFFKYLLKPLPPLWERCLRQRLDDREVSRRGVTAVNSGVPRFRGSTNHTVVISAKMEGTFAGASSLR